MNLSGLSEYLLRRTPEPMELQGRYAVLVPVVEHGGELCLLYEVRAESLGRQPGEVCFPGGRLEPGETPEACALRETEEELGIPPERVRLLGRLDFIVHRANFLLSPVLGYLEGLEGMRLSPAEVGEVFFVPLSHLRAHPPQVYTFSLEPRPGADFPYALLGIPEDYPWQPGEERVPVYPWRGRAIWGLTGRVTRNFIQLLEAWDDGGA